MKYNYLSPAAYGVDLSHKGKGENQGWFCGINKGGSEKCYPEAQIPSPPCGGRWPEGPEGGCLIEYSKGRMRSIILFLAVLISFFIPVSIYAEEIDSAKLVSLLSAITSMQADFVQINKNPQGQVLRKSTGSMLLLRPGKFRWDIKQPQPQQIIADSKQLWIYDPSLAQVIRRHISKANVATSPAALLSNSLEELSAQYQISAVNKPSQKGLFFKLVPEEQSSMLQWLEVHFDNDQLVGMRLMDNLEQLSEFSFHHIRINPILDPGLFKFSPPPNTEVVKA